MDWSYVAGYFDGEGHVGMHAATSRRRPRCSLGWTNTHLASLEAIRDFMGCGAIRTRTNGRFRACYMLLIERRADLQRVIPELLPHCIVKADRLRGMSAYLETATDRSEEWGALSRAGTETIRRLYWDEALTMTAIGQRFGVTQGAVKNFMRRRGVPTRPRGAVQPVRDPATWAARNEKLSTMRRAAWADPNYRARMTERIRAGQAKRIASLRARKAVAD